MDKDAFLVNFFSRNATPHETPNHTPRDTPKHSARIGEEEEVEEFVIPVEIAKSETVFSGNVLERYLFVFWFKENIKNNKCIYSNCT